MAKRKERITINGEEFIIENKTVSPSHLDRNYFRTIDECYDRPSRYKVEIYDEWCDFFLALGSYKFGIESYNCMQFTFGAYFEYEGVQYYAYITKAYNRLYLVA